METFFEAREKRADGVDTITVFPKADALDHARKGVLQDISNLGITSVENVRAGKMFFFQGFTEDEIQRIKTEILQEDTYLDSYDGQISPQDVGDPSQFVCIAYQRQVSNPEINSLQRAIENIGITLTGDKKLQTANVYLLYGDITSEERDRIEQAMVNASVQEGLKKVPDALGIQSLEENTVDSILISELDDEGLIALSTSRRLFLDLEEMRAIKDYFGKIGREPTDCELEIIAQTWSEHCCHKTFKARITINGAPKQPLYTRLKRSTRDINHPDVLSCFVDNAGVVRFDDEHGVCIKVETHNAPFAIEPFGGTETGVGGVIRDVLGTGLGAKPIAVMDILCVGDLALDQGAVPKGCLHPNTLLQKGVAGIASYGNKMGLPNISGAVLFNDCYRAKPIVLAGSIGLISIEKAQKGKPRPGDIILCIGGKTGRDGVHGATFSSGEMTDKTKILDGTAVQIGYPVLERQVMDVLGKLFDRNIIHAITDCGAGGLSSAVTELCEGLGSSINLHEVTTKYQGLRPWERFLSESQERMVIAVSPEESEGVIALCKHYGVNADAVGSVADGNNILRLNCNGTNVAELDLDFVLQQNPRKNIEGACSRPEVVRTEIPDIPFGKIREIALMILNDLNVCSREGVIRRYDHVVEGCTVSPYFQGKNQDTPQDGLILRPKYNSDKGIMTTHGIAPEISEHNPYVGSVTAVIEAIANAIARGADLSKIFLIDNFIHPKPDNFEDVGRLDDSLEGAVSAARAFGTPFVSGKDSLGGTYRNEKGETIKIHPTLAITALSILDNAENGTPSHFQKSGSRIVLLGNHDANNLGGSVFARKLGLKGNDVPEYNLEDLNRLFKRLHGLIKEGHVLSCHDIKEGGLFSALAEMTFGNTIGANLSMDDIDGNLLAFLFNETAGRFIIEVPDGVDIDALCNGIDYRILGRTSCEKRLDIFTHAGSMSIGIEDMKNANHNALFEKLFPADREDLSGLKDNPYKPKSKRRIKTHPMALVVKAPGTNSEQETAKSFEIAGAKSNIVDIADLDPRHFKDAQILAIPGGFAYGDDIGAGKVFALDLIHRFRGSLLEFIEQDKLIIGICNGFQVLAKAGLLPNRNLGNIDASLLHNESGDFSCRYVRMRVEESICRWTKSLEKRTIRIPIAHGEGRFHASQNVLDGIENNRQVAFRYIDNNGQPTLQGPYNPNGSTNAIAGVTDPSGRILGLMPHPERDPRNFIKTCVNDVIGLDIFTGGVDYFQ